MNFLFFGLILIVDVSWKIIRKKIQIFFLQNVKNLVNKVVFSFLGAIM